jgi:DNA repair exonuclease SbcCD ATPase subunit
MPMFVENGTQTRAPPTPSTTRTPPTSLSTRVSSSPNLRNVISNLRNENAKLIAKVENLNICDDSLVKLKNDNDNLIAKIDKLNESIASLKIENDKLITKTKNLNVCNDIVSNLRNENVMLHAKIDELNACKPSTSTVSHVSICTRCRDVNIDVIHDHIAMIKQKMII